MPTPSECSVDLAEIAFVEQIKTVSPELAGWTELELLKGRSVEQIKTQLRRVMRVVTPLREAEAPVAENVSRTETEFNLNWARENPELFAQAVAAFQTKTPITHWQHFVDLSRQSFMKLIAARRDKPFDSVTDYVMEDKLYLRETGYDV